MNEYEVSEVGDMRDWIIGLLKEEMPIKVTFTKKDGTERVMKCTKNISNIPVDMHPTGEKEIKEGNVLRVFDLENSGWRSFNVESVKEVSFSIGE